MVSTVKLTPSALKSFMWLLASVTASNPAKLLEKKRKRERLLSYGFLTWSNDSSFLIGEDSMMSSQALDLHAGLIDLFSLYVLFSHFRPRDATRGNSFFQMSSYARANVRITNAENKRQIPMRASRGLKWENKTYKLKRSIHAFFFLFYPIFNRKPSFLSPLFHLQCKEEY